MLQLIHHPFCPHSRFVRLILYEYEIQVHLIGERVWERRQEFLALNPAGTLPVLLVEGQSPVPGAAVIAVYLDETIGANFGNRRLLPLEMLTRIEVRRLTYWFSNKFFAEVSGLLTEERYKQYMSSEAGGGSPNYALIRDARENVHDHIAYIDYLLLEQDWLGGPRLTYADLAAAAHLSVIDHLDDLPWAQAKNAKNWFERMQSRPSFGLMLAEGWRGFIRI
jgi:glutathione S-transferase